MASNSKVSTPLSEFRRAAAKALREKKQNFEMEKCDPPVEFYLISNLIANGNPKSTLEEILQTETPPPPLDSAVPSNTSEMETATLPILETITTESLPIPETVTTESLPIPEAVTSVSSPILQTVTAESTPIPETVTPMSSPIVQKITPESTPVPPPILHTVTSEPLLIWETVPKGPTLYSMPQMATKHKPPPNTQPYILQPEKKSLQSMYYANDMEHVDWPRRLELIPARQRARVATAAAAAATATVAAQVRQDALDAIAYKHAPFLRMAAKEIQNDQRRVKRNTNLLSSALSIISEMDAAYLEILCYAIHDQVTKNESSD